MLYEYDIDNAYEILKELNLDSTAYDYYREALDEICIKDKLSIKNGHGYKSIAAVLKDARKTAKTNC